jgi:hypothetical protein
VIGWKCRSETPSAQLVTCTGWRPTSHTRIDVQTRRRPHHLQLGDLRVRRRDDRTCPTTTAAWAALVGARLTHSTCAEHREQGIGP